MPSTFAPPGDGSTRRRALASLGTAVAGSLTGCSGRIAGARTLDAETTVERDADPRVRWRYPPREGDADGIGYAAVEATRVRRRTIREPALRLGFSVTVGDIAAAEPYRGYRLERVRFRIRPRRATRGVPTTTSASNPPASGKGSARTTTCAAASVEPPSNSGTSIRRAPSRFPPSSTRRRTRSPTASTARLRSARRAPVCSERQRGSLRRERSP